jgi:hypothetical protein
MLRAAPEIRRFQRPVFCALRNRLRKRKEYF